MKVLVDERVDWRLSRELVGHEVKTARQMGWSTVRNGELLALAEEEFDVFVTVDRNLSFQIEFSHERVLAEIESWPVDVLADYARLVELLAEYRPSLRLPQ